MMFRIRFLFLSSSLLLVFSYCRQPVAEVPASPAAVDAFSFDELPDPKPGDPAVFVALGDNLGVAFADTDTRYAKKTVPSVESRTNWEARGWRGERVHTQLLLWTNNPVQVTVTPSSLTGEGHIPGEAVSVAFVRYVMADEFGSTEGCNDRTPEAYDSTLVADALDYSTGFLIEEQSTRPVWVAIDIPSDAAAGTYTGHLTVSTAAGISMEMPITLLVSPRTLPAPSEWDFHLDLWQNSFAVARAHGVEPWSQAHFDALRPQLERLAQAGQKCITTSIIDKPWNGQTFDPFQAMVRWTKHADGSWDYDYTVFDKYVEFAMSCGITEQINCYTMIPWGLKFQYFDEASQDNVILVAEPGTAEYAAHWGGFLSDFSAHLTAKGWLEKTAISMDERPMEAMRGAIAVIKKAAPNLKVTLAGGYHGEIEADIYDYCLASGEESPKNILEERNAAGKFTTFYTCCVERYPNTFTFSPPAESAWLGWYAAARGYSGYLRWAHFSWVENPLTDSRFRRWPAGDTYFVYPGNRSSIRFERLREGIQAFEKIRILREEWKGQPEKLGALDEVVADFEITNLSRTPAAEMVQQANDRLWALSEGNGK
ncbi:MAG: DUF4091 domain-containing protein [Cyclobacteriaceae bacterium]|nr:DUF4091 domain-containing protein [Cyclobacteriaceae bacterium]